MRRYYGTISWFDATVGRLLDALDERGLADDTLVLFVVDNGWRPSPRPGKDEGEDRTKGSPSESGIRTPLLVRWPGVVDPGHTDFLASSVDVLPTLLSAACLPADPQLPGLDLLEPAARGVLPERNVVFGANFSLVATRLDDPAADLRHRWLRRGRYKLVVPTSPDEKTALYDLEEDGEERVNLARWHRPLRERLEADLDAWWSPGIARSRAAPN